MIPEKLKTKLTELKGKMDEQMSEADKITKTAREEGRGFTDDERKASAACLKEAQNIKAEFDSLISDVEVLKSFDGLSKSIGLPVDDHGQPSGEPDGSGRGVKTVGQLFVESKQYESIKDPAARSGSWTSGPLELDEYQKLAGQKATLTEAAGGGALLQPDVIPGILPILFRRMVVADLMLTGSTTSNLVRYMLETLATNAAAPVAEGAAKPESALEFSVVDESVRKIATFLPITDEMLEDWAQARSYIDGRLGLFIRLTEEDQLLNGSGTAPALRGLRNRTGLTATRNKGADTIADAVFKQIMDIANGSFLMPDGIVMNPADWTTARLAKDSTGQYLGGGPFGSGATVVNGVQFERYWGLPTVVTPEQPAGEVFIGAFSQAAQIFRRGGLTIEASNSHNDFFQKNLTALRAEERLALAVYRPAAFGKVNLLA
jgi:HK97 family phage major capsid protein